MMAGNEENAHPRVVRRLMRALTTADRDDEETLSAWLEQVDEDEDSVGIHLVRVREPSRPAKLETRRLPRLTDAPTVRLRRNRPAPPVDPDPEEDDEEPGPLAPDDVLFVWAGLFVLLVSLACIAGVLLAVGVLST